MKGMMEAITELLEEDIRGVKGEIGVLLKNDEHYGKVRMKPEEAIDEYDSFDSSVIETWRSIDPYALSKYESKIQNARLKHGL